MENSSARVVLTIVTSVGVETLAKYYTKCKVFEYFNYLSKNYTCVYFLIQQSLTLLSAQCRLVNAACCYTSGPIPLSQTPNSSLNMSNVATRIVVQWVAHCSTSLTLVLYIF